MSLFSSSAFLSLTFKFHVCLRILKGRRLRHPFDLFSRESNSPPTFLRRIGKQRPLVWASRRCWYNFSAVHWVRCAKYHPMWRKAGGRLRQLSLPGALVHLFTTPGRLLLTKHLLVWSQTVNYRNGDGKGWKRRRGDKQNIRDTTQIQAKSQRINYKSSWMRVRKPRLARTATGFTREGSAPTTKWFLKPTLPIYLTKSVYKKTCGSLAIAPTRTNEMSLPVCSRIRNMTNFRGREREGSGRTGGRGLSWYEIFDLNAPNLISWGEWRKKRKKSRLKVVFFFR